MITLAAAQTIAAKAGTASAITYTLHGDEVTTADAFQQLSQGTVGTTAAAIFTSPTSTATLVKQIHFANVTSSSVTLVVYANGTASTNQIYQCTIPANGSVVHHDGGWQVYDQLGNLQTTFANAIGSLQALVTFTSSGTFNPASYPLAKAIRVRAVGGGGGGGGCAATTSGIVNAGPGGGGGSYSESWISLSGLASQTVTIGAGGSGGVGGGAAATAGGASSFGTLVTASGGAAASSTSAAAAMSLIGASGGAAGTGNIAVPGSSGGTSFGTNGGVIISGAGAPGYLGAQGGAAVGATNAGQAASSSAYGAGGSGAALAASSAAANGGAGAAGIVIVEVYG